MKRKNKVIIGIILSCVAFLILFVAYMLKNPIQIEKRIEQHWLNSTKSIKSLTGSMSYEYDDEKITYDGEFIDGNIDYESMEKYGTYSVWKTKQKKNGMSILSTQYAGLIDREHDTVYTQIPEKQAYKNVTNYFAWDCFTQWYQHTHYETQKHWKNIFVGELPSDEIALFLKQYLFHDKIVIVPDDGYLEFYFQSITCKLKNVLFKIPDFQVIIDNETKTIHNFTFEINFVTLPSNDFFEKPNDLSSYPVEFLQSMNDRVIKPLSENDSCLHYADYVCTFAKHSFYDSYTVSNDVLYVKPVSKTIPEITVRFIDSLDISADILLDKDRSLIWYHQQDDLSDFFVSDIKQISFLDKNAYSYYRQYTDTVNKFVSKEFIYLLPINETLCVQMIVSQVFNLGDTVSLTEQYATDLLSYLVINKDGDE